jgi:hypothetical protein
MGQLPAAWLMTQINVAKMKFVKIATPKYLFILWFIPVYLQNVNIIRIISQRAALSSERRALALVLTTDRAGVRLYGELMPKP